MINKSLAEYISFLDMSEERYELSPQRELEPQSLDRRDLYDLIDKINWLLHRFCPDEIEKLNLIENREEIRYMLADLRNEYSYYSCRIFPSGAIKKVEYLIEEYKEKHPEYFTDNVNLYLDKWRKELEIDVQEESK